MELRYPEHIVKCIRQRLGLEEDDTSRDEEISLMTPPEVFEEVLEWDGLIGYFCTIKNWIEDIYGFDIDEMVDYG